MLKYLFELDEIEPTAQRTLFDLYVQRKDHRSLARLGHLPNLLDELDVELGKMDAAPVVEAWVTRPGRKLEDVVARLRKERRVGVLTACAALDLDESLYEAIASANDSSTVAVAVLEAERAPVAARCTAAVNAAKALDADRKVAEDSVRAALATYPEAAEAFALASTTSRSVASAVTAETLSPDAARHLAEVVVAALQTATDEDAAGATSYGYSATSRFERLRHLAAEILQATWCTPEVRTLLGSALEVTGTVLGARHDSDEGYIRTYWKQLSDELVATAALATSAEHGGGALGPLVLAARNARCAADLAEVDEGMAGSYNENHQRRTVLAGAVLLNPHLPVEARLRAAEQYPNPWHLMRAKRFLELPVESWVALCLVRPWGFAADALAAAGKGPEFTRALAENYHLRPGHHALQVLLASRDLAPDMLLGLPVQDLSGSLHADGVPHEVRKVVAAAVAEALADDPLNVWVMFDQMANSYTGTLNQLVGLCRAAVV